MWRVVKTLFWGALVLGVAWFIASLPGRISFDVGPYTVETSDSFALVALLLVFVVSLGLLRLVTLMLSLPRTGSRWRRERRRRAGDLAVTRTLVALAAGEKGDARREANRARALLGDTPQTLLLTAEAGRLSGRDDEAAEAFRALAARKDAAFLGLRGLLANAITRQDWSEAASFARQAEAAHPGAAWLHAERAQLAVRAGDWAEALMLSGPAGPSGRSPIAALAVGAALKATNPDRAERLARRALRADPSFTPAVLTLAEQARARGREKKAQAILAEGWKRAPHPDIATLALAPVTDKLTRATAARQLTSSLPDHEETHLLLAHTALEAGVLGEARRHLEAMRNAGCNQRRMWLLLAELEEEDRGDTDAGRIAQRDALRRAANADPDPVWRCAVCRATPSSWQAACQVCLSPGSLTWGAAQDPAVQNDAAAASGGTQIITQAA